MEQTTAFIDQIGKVGEAMKEGFGALGAGSDAGSAGSVEGSGIVETITGGIAKIADAVPNLLNLI